MAPIDSSELYGDEHVRRYLETDGEEGHDWRKGSSILLLTTTGRRSGEERTAALIYGRSGDDYLVVASDGGAPGHPGWYAQPRGRSRGRGAGDRRPLPRARAHRERRGAPGDVGGDDVALARLRRYQRRTDREIPVVVLERAG